MIISGQTISYNIGSDRIGSDRIGSGHSKQIRLKQAEQIGASMLEQTENRRLDLEYRSIVEIEEKTTEERAEQNSSG